MTINIVYWTLMQQPFIFATGMFLARAVKLSRRAVVDVGNGLAGMWACIGIAHLLLVDQFPIFETAVTYFCLWIAWRNRPPRNKKRVRRWLGNKAKAARAKIIDSMPKWHPRPLPA